MRDGTRRSRLVKRIAELSAAEAVVLAIAFIAGAVVALSLQHVVGGGSGKRTVEAFADVPETEAGTLAEQFRPWLAFDSGEHWRPLDVAAMLDEGRHRFCTQTPDRLDCTTIHAAGEFDALARQAATPGSATYLDVAGGKVADYHGPEQCTPPLEDCGDGSRSTVYYHATRSNDRVYVDYWWFLRFNHFGPSHPAESCLVAKARASGVCDEHEGDWEGVTVVTPPDDEEHVDYVVYAAHKGTFRYAASELNMHGTRPTVYVAQGSHASYPAPCARHCRQPAGLAVDGLVDLPEGNFDGRASWARNGDTCTANVAGSCLRSLPLQAWDNWSGKWGAGCGDACRGAVGAISPASPGLQLRYQTPWCSTQNGTFTCDSRALRCSDWLGPQVVAVACDPAVLSKGLRATTAIDPGGLRLTIRGSEHSQATTPGVVQALGEPLQPGETASVVADGGAIQVLVRAEQDGVVAEDRFAGFTAAPGQRIAITVSAGAEAPVVLADGHRPVERRILATVADAATSGGEGSTVRP